jgi:hypothetical protein
MGIYGYWGELHTPYLDNEMQTIFAETFTNSFRHKKIMTHHRENYDITYFDSYYADNKFGIYWDSFAHPEENFMKEDIISLDDYWKTQVLGGETAYNWGGVNEVQGDNPTQTVSTPAYFNRLTNYIRYCHGNHIGWVADYDYNDPQTAQGAEQLQKALGYRFVIDEVKFPGIITRGENFQISISVSNQGSSPFYYWWPFEAVLLDREDHHVVWSEIFESADIRKWLPGDDWIFDENDPSVLGAGYASPPESVTETGVFNLPDEIPSGSYILAFALLDPSGMTPTIKFATSNYMNGGYHPVAYIGVEDNPEDFNLYDINFDDPQSDRSLHYVYPTPPAIVVTSPTGKDCWAAGQTAEVTWKSFGVTGDISIDLSTDAGETWTALVSGVKNSGSHEITVPAGSASRCRIRIRAVDGSAMDISNADFVIEQR